MSGQTNTGKKNIHDTVDESAGETVPSSETGTSGRTYFYRKAGSV